ncbi:MULTISPECIES: GspH/FimT family pseudopilin [unclassified Lysobacter]|uniref:GspH/FimT family pseudopilin n=1 Tax=unclassified Lysobacter TaxID=2635362 RepID=UPI001C229037|nr:GspH/FimT family pseudopilin [Lysobacter sp. MMG2]MBU8976436.1 GspH/FimT family pseudopilin [Lysobacter sp. MMG2]
MHHSKGLTLPELIVALAVLAIGATLAWPGFSALILRTKGTTALHLLGTALASARMAAVSRRVPMTVCPSADGRQCRKDPVWEDGWIVYRDRLARDQPQSQADVLQRFTIDRDAFTLRSTPGRLRVRYIPSGATATNNLTILLCERRAQREVGRVVVSRPGRIRTQRPRALAPGCIF